jgi:Trk-type K+ transport system membrane component
MKEGLLVQWFATVAPRVLLLFGIGFLIANVIAGIDLFRYHRWKRTALLLWPRPKPRYYGISVLLGVILGLLIIAEILLKRPMSSLFGETMMFVYYACLFPLRVRIARGFFQNGVWADTGFMRWADISAVSWKEEKTLTLILLSKARNVARRLGVPVERYGEARRLLQDRIKAQDLNIRGAGLDLGTREGGDSI